VPEWSAFLAAVEMALKSEVAALQELQPMELGGFEPPTSWVRSASTMIAEGVKRGRLPACLLASL
jgi:hypothetical protein